MNNDFMNVAAVAHAVFDERRRLQVEHDDVGLHAERDAADLVLEIQRLRGAARCQIERVARPTACCRSDCATL